MSQAIGRGQAAVLERVQVKLSVCQAVEMIDLPAVLDQARATSMFQIAGMTDLLRVGKQVLQGSTLQKADLIHTVRRMLWLGTDYASTVNNSVQLVLCQ
jgi:DNA polymerase III psi subunit